MDTKGLRDLTRDLKNIDNERAQGPRDLEAIRDNETSAQFRCWLRQVATQGGLPPKSADDAAAVEFVLGAVTIPKEVEARIRHRWHVSIEAKLPRTPQPTISRLEPLFQFRAGSSVTEGDRREAERAIEELRRILREGEKKPDEELV